MGPRPNNRPGQKPNNVKKDEDGLRINEEITASQVRLVGEKEMNDGTVSVRRQGGVDAGTMPVDSFVELVSNEIKDQLS